MRDIHISIVSHGQGAYVHRLLEDLCVLSSASRLQVSVVLNIPESQGDSFSETHFPVRIVRNATPRGFGENHNLAFHTAPCPDERAFFVVLNPDLRLREDGVGALADQLMTHDSIGVVAPAVYSPQDVLEDSARELPTPIGLLRKVFGRKGGQNTEGGGLPFFPDWVAGMFMMFPVDVFSQIGGFDESYFLYYEDVDICSRLWISGYSVVLDPGHSIVHDAQRTSHKSWRYARWHLVSIARFLSSRVFRRARRLHRTRVGRPHYANH